MPTDDSSPATGVPAFALPRLGLGTMTFGDQVEVGRARGLVEQALVAGAVMIDTANVYAAGRSETIVGQVLEGRRERVLLATKVGIPISAQDTAPLAPERIRDELESSLRRLHTDHVDLYYLHQPDRATPFEESLSAIGALIEEGKVRSWGVSNFAAWQIAELRHVALGLGMPLPTAAQQPYNLLSRRLEDEYAEFARATGIATVVYNPLAGGLLTGKHHLASEPTEGRFASEMYRERYWNVTTHAAVGRLQDLAADLGLTLVQLALRWLLSGDVATSVLLGASRAEHLAENLAAVSDVPLGAEALDVCDEVWASLRGVAPAYNR